MEPRQLLPKELVPPASPPARATASNVRAYQQQVEVLQHKLQVAALCCGVAADSLRCSTHSVGTIRRWMLAAAASAGILVSHASLQIKPPFVPISVCRK